MGEKDIETLPGIGIVAGTKLRNVGYDKAYILLGQFLIFKKNKALLSDWLREHTKMNQKQLKDCTECLYEWSYNFI